jgi:hypothetical protein
MHSSGVTRRIPEVVTLFPELEIDFRDDFRQNISGDSLNNRSLVKHIKKWLHKIATISGLIRSCDDDSSYTNIKWWTLVLRGHYSYRSISDEFLEILSNNIQRSSDSLVSASPYSCVIHYRLGDLITLEEKAPVDAERLTEVLLRLNQARDFDEVLVLSDSPDEALRRIESYTKFRLTKLETDSISTIYLSSNAQFFLGTSSKISFWIAGLRSLKGSRNTALPRENFRETQGLLKNTFDEVIFY